MIRFIAIAIVSLTCCTALFGQSNAPGAPGLDAQWPSAAKNGFESPPEVLRFGEGTGSATPLAWSMAQFIRLTMNIKNGHHSETPQVVANRYIKRPEGRNERSN